MSDRYARNRLGLLQCGHMPKDECACAKDISVRGLKLMTDAAERQGQIRALRSMARWLRKEAARFKDVQDLSSYNRATLNAALHCERRARKLEKEKA